MNQNTPSVSNTAPAQVYKPQKHMFRETERNLTPSNLSTFGTYLKKNLKNVTQCRSNLTCRPIVSLMSVRSFKHIRVFGMNERSIRPLLFMNESGFGFWFHQKGRWNNRRRGRGLAVWFHSRGGGGGLFVDLAVAGDVRVAFRFHWKQYVSEILCEFYRSYLKKNLREGVL